MENLQAITSFFQSIWNVFTLRHPLLGIPFSVIYLGAFAIGISIVFLKPILGIGYGAVGDISANAREARKSAVYRIQTRKSVSESEDQS